MLSKVDTREADDIVNTYDQSQVQVTALSSLSALLVAINVALAVRHRALYANETDALAQCHCHSIYSIQDTAFV